MLHVYFIKAKYQVQQVLIKQKKVMRIIIGHIIPLASQLLLHENILNETIVTINLERNFHKIWMDVNVDYWILFCSSPKKITPNFSQWFQVPLKYSFS